MAVDKKEKKRKASSTVAPAANEHPPSKKSKKASGKSVKEPVKDTKPSIDKELKSTDATKPPKAEKENSKPLTKALKARPRKRAADFLSDEESIDNDASSDNEAKPSSPVQAKKKAKPEPVETKNRFATIAKKGGQSKQATEDKNKSQAKSPKKADAKNTADESDEEEDDQTAALIKGFESSDDEKDPSEDEGYEPGQDAGKIPDSKQVKRRIKSTQKRQEEPEAPGVVYLGRIPHGFYEHPMRAYFSQFGNIRRLRLSRNKTTGRSKHYGFIEFDSTSVAKVVADTMDNYLMFGHILKCKYIPAESVHPDLFQGANRTWQKTPWNRIEKKRLDAPKTRDHWTKAVEREGLKRTKKAEKLAALGYEFEMPKLKSVDEVPVQEKPEALEDAPAEAVEGAGEEETKLIEEAPKSAEEPKGKKSKNGGNVGDKAEATKETKTKTPAASKEPVKGEEGQPKKATAEVKPGKKARKNAKSNDRATEQVEKPQKAVKADKAEKKQKKKAKK